MCDPVKYIKNKCKALRAQDGFTLVEVTIVMLVVGIMAASALQLYKTYVMQSRMEQTEVNRKLSALSLDEFKRRYGRYPCPARYDADRDDPDYGREGNCQDLTVVPGNCANGYCVEVSEREVTLKDGVTKVFPRVRRGALPFRDMYMSEDVTYDKYKGRFSYAVTELLTDTDTFDVYAGGISIVDNKEPVANSLVEPPGSALYFLFSHGPDNNGAYNYSGMLMAPCDGTMHDNENCNTGAAHATAIYRHKPASTVPVDDVNASAAGGGGGPPGPTINANTHYDDFAAYASTEEQPLWKYSEVPGNENNIHDLLDTQEVLDIGEPDDITDPNLAVDLKLDVDGDVRADQKARATDYCNSDKGDCTQAYRIGGTGMTECAGTGDAGVGVAYNKILCGTKPTLAASCPDGEFMTGIDSSGQPICQTITKPKACAATTKRVCGVNKPLAESPKGTSITLTGGASFSQTWTCQGGNNPSWRNTAESGVCNCTASTAITGGLACGAGFGNNTFTRTVTTVCPAGTTTTTDTRAQTCICVPFTETRNQACSGNLTGGIAQTRNVTCVNNVPTNGPWTNVPNGNTCICALAPTQVTTSACPNAQTGNITTTSTLNTTTCTYGAGTSTNNCTCVDPGPQTRDRTCAAPTTGVYKQQRTFQCPAGTWSGWTDLPNSVSTNCKCIDSTQTRDVASCAPGETGGHKEQRTVDCYGTPVSGSAGQWTMIPGSLKCDAPPAPPVCTWASSGTPVGPAGTSGNPRVNSVCTCGSAANLCYVGLGGSIFQGYQCTCGQ